MIFPKDKEPKCYLDRRNKMHIHIYWRSYFGTMSLSEEFYKLLIKCPNKYCNKIRFMLTSCFLCAIPMLLSLYFTDTDHFHLHWASTTYSPHFLELTMCQAEGSWCISINIFNALSENEVLLFSFYS